MSWIKGKKQTTETCEKKLLNAGMRTHGMYRSRFYKIWVNMKTRCLNKKNRSFCNYGGRGIEIKWENFEEFRNDMYKSYVEHSNVHTERNTTIERIDCNGDYSKENCRWATRQEQARNLRRNAPLSVYGKIALIKDWAEVTGIHQGTIRSRIRLGWTPEEAVSVKQSKDKYSRIWTIRNKRYDL